MKTSQQELLSREAVYTPDFVAAPQINRNLIQKAGCSNLKRSKKVCSAAPFQLCSLAVAESTCYVPHQGWGVWGEEELPQSIPPGTQDLGQVPNCALRDGLETVV